jgi:tRNA uridine 5-carboxymethylaminomethyl modification enzyme
MYGRSLCVVLCHHHAADGTRLQTKTIVLTTGTFLNGEIYTGSSALCPKVVHIVVGGKTQPGGRRGDRASIGLSQTLSRFNFKLGRLKTGTPPRLDGRTIDYSELQKQLRQECSFFFDDFHIALAMTRPSPFLSSTLA